MMKTELRQKLVAIVFVVVLLCTVLAGMVSAENAGAKSDAVNDTLCGNDSTSSSNSSYPSSQNTSANNSLSSEIDRFLDANKSVFLFFHADDCHSCQQQEHIIDELEQEYADTITFLRLNAKENLQPLGQGHIFCTQRQVKGVNKIGLITYPENDRAVLSKSLMRENLRSGSVRGFIAAYGRWGLWLY